MIEVSATTVSSSRSLQIASVRLFLAVMKVIIMPSPSTYIVRVVPTVTFLTLRNPLSVNGHIMGGLDPIYDIHLSSVKFLV